MLPLDAADERSITEQQIEATKILMKVAGTVKVDLPVEQLTDQTVDDYPNIAEPVASYALAYLVSRLLHARNHRNDLHATLGAPPLANGEQDGPDYWWGRLEGFIWMWDAGIQDCLASGAFGTASAYQLGRGLAEAYWALNPEDAPTSPRSWHLLLGENRTTALSLLCRRLSPAIGKITAPAIAASVEAWQVVAESPSEYFEPFAQLGDQLLVWRDLLLTQRDPTSLVDKKVLEKSSARILPLMNAFKWELMLGVGASAALGLSTHYLPNLGGSIGAVLSAFGITAAAVGSRAKAVIQSVTDRVRNSLSQDLVTQVVVRTPTKKSSGRFAGLGRGAQPTPLVSAVKP
jgi:hypothetical protein